MIFLILFINFKTMGSSCSVPEPNSTTNSIPVPNSNTNSITNSIPNSDFENRILKLHNDARIKNGLNPLVWNVSLQTKAADWLNHLDSQNENGLICSKMRHPGTEADGNEEEIGQFLPNGNGQNLYQANGSSYINYQFTPYDPSSPEDAVKKWYDECEIFKTIDPSSYSSSNSIPDRFMEIGHMTQLLWKSATQVGCASHKCVDKVKGADGKLRDTIGTVINCHYDKGNIAGQFKDQLPNDIKCPF